MLVPRTSLKLIDRTKGTHILKSSLSLLDKNSLQLLGTFFSMSSNTFKLIQDVLHITAARKTGLWFMVQKCINNKKTKLKWNFSTILISLSISPDFISNFNQPTLLCYESSLYLSVTSRCKMKAPISKVPASTLAPFSGFLLQVLAVMQRAMASTL